MLEIGAINNANMLQLNQNGSTISIPRPQFQDTPIVIRNKVGCGEHRLSIENVAAYNVRMVVEIIALLVLGSCIWDKVDPVLMNAPFRFFQ